MAINKISTQAYTIKRLRDSGYNVYKLDIAYLVDDNRKWTILVDAGVANIFVTCYKDGKFALYDGGQFTINNLKNKTDSVEVLIEELHALGIINKHPNYSNRTLVINSTAEIT